MWFRQFCFLCVLDVPCRTIDSDDSDTHIISAAALCGDAILHIRLHTRSKERRDSASPRRQPTATVMDGCPVHFDPRTMIPTMIDVGLLFLFACCSALALSRSLAFSLTTALHLPAAWGHRSAFGAPSSALALGGIAASSVSHRAGSGHLNLGRIWRRGASDPSQNLRRNLRRNPRIHCGVCGGGRCPGTVGGAGG